MEPPRIAVIVGSTRDGRRAERVASWFAALADAREDLRFEYHDLRAWALPAFDDPVVPARRPEPPPDGVVRRWSDAMERADGFVLVTPEYNHGYPAPLKNALDLVAHPWRRKPLTFVTYGGSAGGVRAAEQLVQVAIELELAPLRRQVHIPMIGRVFGSRGSGELDPRHAEAAALALDELAWWARALRAARAAAAP